MLENTTDPEMLGHTRTEMQKFTNSVSMASVLLCIAILFSFLIY